MVDVENVNNPPSFTRQQIKSPTRIQTNFKDGSVKLPKLSVQHQSSDTNSEIASPMPHRYMNDGFG